MNYCSIKYYLFIFLLLATTLTACGTYDTSPNKNSQSDTDKSPGLNYTAVSFSLTIDDNPDSLIPSPLAGKDKAISPPLQGEGQGGDGVAYIPRTLAKLDCTASSISTIEIAVYDSTGTELVKKSFNCNAHSGNIEVPSGGNRKFVFSGKNSSGAEVYRGERTNVDCQPGATYNIGEVPLSPVKTKPSAPTGVIATAGDGHVTISWDIFTGATSYNIYWSTTSGVTKATGIKISVINSTSYTHTGLSNGTSYYYVVTAVDGNGEGKESNQVMVIPPQIPIRLPKTGQTICSANVIACIGTGQDGELQKGVAWPNPRFTDNGGGTMTDNLTGLVWTKDANTPGPVACFPGNTKTWQGALDYVACLNANSYLGYTDWRLPNVNELKSFVHYGQPDTATWLKTQGFNNVQSSYYWSSTSFARYPGNAWVVYMWNGYVYFYTKSSYSYYVWPVRSGQSWLLGTSTISIPGTGQTTCYNSSGSLIACAGTGHDGNLQKGVAWPNPRFTDNGGGTMTDNLTGLVWTKDGNAPGPVACSPAVTKTWQWQGALDYVACLNANSYLGYTDWRLPNVNELKSFVHYGQPDTATWLKTQGFNNVQSSSYWSSTSSAFYPYDAWFVYMWNGHVSDGNKSSYGSYVWPVRSGQ